MADLSTIGRGTTVRGNVRGDGDLDIHGRVEGSVSVKGELSIAETALIKSDVSGRRVVVRGAVAGNVTAEESLVLEAGARVVGDLVAPRIGIRPGALLRGNVSTDGSVPARAATASKASHAQPSAARPVALAAPPPRAVAPAAQAKQAPASPAPPARATAKNGSRTAGPPPPVVPSIGKGAKATLKRKGAR